VVAGGVSCCRWLAERILRGNCSWLPAPCPPVGGTHSVTCAGAGWRAKLWSVALLLSAADSSRGSIRVGAAERGAVSPGSAEAAGRPVGPCQPYMAADSLPGAGARQPWGLLLVEFSLKGFIQICIPYMNNSPFLWRSTDPHARSRLLMT